MARVTHVKAARKDYPQAGIKKGQPYWWWAFMVGGRGGPKIRSTTYPRPSQLTQSEFVGTLLRLQEDNAYPPDLDEIEDKRDEIKTTLENLRDETQGKFDNLPEGLQQGESGQLLERRVASLDEAIDQFDNIDTTYERGPGVEEDSDEDEEKKSERAQEIWEEVMDLVSNVDAN